MDKKIPASNFVGTVAANVDNTKLSDEEFRQFVRNTLPIVEYDRPAEPWVDYEALEKDIIERHITVNNEWYKALQRSIHELFQRYRNYPDEDLLSQHHVSINVSGVQNTAVSIVSSAILEARKRARNTSRC